MRCHHPSWTVLLRTLLGIGLLSSPLTADEPAAKKEQQTDAQAAEGKDEAAAKPSAAKDGAKVQVTSVFRAADLLELDVRNMQGKEIGALSDVVIDLHTGEIRYVALSTGGFAGFNDKLFAVPWSAVKFKFGEEDRYLVVNVTEDQLKRARGFDEDHWPNFADPDWAAQVKKDFDVAEKDRDNDEAKDAEAKAAPEKSGVKKKGEKVLYDAVYRVSTLKGMEVRSKQNENLGAIDELVFDLQRGKVAYVALSHGGVLGVGTKLFAVPFDAFTLKHDADETFMVLAVDADKLKSAPGFNQDQWPNTADPKWSAEIDKHYELSRRPATERKEPRRE